MVKQIVTSIVMILSLYEQANSHEPTSANQNSSGSSALITSENYGSDLSEAIPNVFIPALSNVPETCAISNSAGGSISGFGFGFGKSKVEMECSRRMYARLVGQLGDTEAAKNILCFNDEVRESYREAGRPCPDNNDHSKKPKRRHK